MDDESKLIKQISILQKVSLGIVVLYFAAKYIFKVDSAMSFILIVPLLLVVLYRSYLEYKLTGSKTKLILFSVAMLVTAGVAAYFYFNH